jgi:hypothetical protein
MKTRETSWQETKKDRLWEERTDGGLSTTDPYKMEMKPEEQDILVSEEMVHFSVSNRSTHTKLNLPSAYIQ